jgi:cbb3-type cytochrome oxidase maturation protein
MAGRQILPGGVMSNLLFLIPIALGLGFLGLLGFLWALKTNQFEDLEGSAHRILDDDDKPLK